MAHNLIAIQARVWVCHEQFADKIFGFCRDTAPGWRVEVVLTLLDLLKQSEVVFIIEGRGTREEDE